MNKINAWLPIAILFVFVWQTKGEEIILCNTEFAQRPFIVSRLYHEGDKIISEVVVAKTFSVKAGAGRVEVKMSNVTVSRTKIGSNSSSSAIPEVNQERFEVGDLAMNFNWETRLICNGKISALAQYKPGDGVQRSNLEKRK